MHFLILATTLHIVPSLSFPLKLEVESNQLTFFSELSLSMPSHCRYISHLFFPPSTDLFFSLLFGLWATIKLSPCNLYITSSNHRIISHWSAWVRINYVHHSPYCTAILLIMHYYGMLHALDGLHFSFLGDSQHTIWKTDCSTDGSSFS